MNRDEYQRAKEIFHSALELPPSERSVYLDEKCSVDTTLRRQIERMLDSFDSDYLEEPAVDEFAGLVLSGELEKGTIVGHYEIREKVGSGGMGDVYLAEDLELRRLAALKILPPEFSADSERSRRFLREARSASALNHPNIVTIYDIGTFESGRFIATEYVRGETLRELIKRAAPLSLPTVIEIAVQIAAALEASHTMGIIHRDIKPENIMIREDGLVKVLDFGLAKPVESSCSVSEVKADEDVRFTTTTPGLVMGTIAYMSPEQTRGLSLDERTDIWSLGVCLYEMLTGKALFNGQTSSDVLAEILTKDTSRLFSNETPIPPSLERIIDRLLQKDRAARFQTSKQLHDDLETFRFELKSGEIRGVSGAEKITRQIRKHPRRIFSGLAVVVLLFLAGFVYYNFQKRPPTPALTDKDVILIADFENKTGDAIFDGTLKQGLSIQLQQSPFLSLFSDAQVQTTLKLMRRSPDEKITKEIAREICQRQGLKAFIAGTVAPLGTKYVLTLQAVNAQTDEPLASEQLEAEAKEQILEILAKMSGRLREKLGESLVTIEKLDIPPWQITTTSLDALKLVFLARQEARRGNWKQAIQFIRKAIEIDPDFAMAYRLLAVYYSNNQQPELAVEPITKAFEIRERVSEWESLTISETYYGTVTKDFDRLVEVLETKKRLYPRDYQANGSLASRYYEYGDYRKAAAEAKVAIEKGAVLQFATLAHSLRALGQYDEAQAAVEEGNRLGNEDLYMHEALVDLAFLKKDEAAFEKATDYLKTRDLQHRANFYRGLREAYAGRMNKGREFIQEAVALARQRNSNEWVVRYLFNEAWLAAWSGQCDIARPTAEQALAVVRSDEALDVAAHVFGMCGDRPRAQTLLTELIKKRPNGTIVNNLTTPAVQAVLESKGENPAAAIELLRAVPSNLENAGKFRIQYLRGNAYLKLNKGAEAAAEFQKILDHPGEAPFSPLYPLAHLGLARALMQMGETEKAREAYRKFFEIWRDADADLPVLIEAKREFGKLRVKYKWT